jgi:hypothetical protein
VNLSVYRSNLTFQLITYSFLNYLKPRDLQTNGNWFHDDPVSYYFMSAFQNTEDQDIQNNNFSVLSGYETWSLTLR